MLSFRLFFLVILLFKQIIITFNRGNIFGWRSRLHIPPAASEGILSWPSPVPMVGAQLMFTQESSARLLCAKH